jgi:hypothetical protein
VAPWLVDGPLVRVSLQLPTARFEAIRLAISRAFHAVRFESQQFQVCSARIYARIHQLLSLLLCEHPCVLTAAD